VDDVTLWQVPVQGWLLGLHITGTAHDMYIDDSHQLSV